MEAVCLAVNFCFLKRKEPLEVIRNSAVLATILSHNFEEHMTASPEKVGFG
jgi:hypothetical protein